MSYAPVPARKPPETLAERFWSLARGKDFRAYHPNKIDPVRVVDHVLAVLDALERGEVGDGLSVNTLSFLKLLREHELRGDLSYASPEQIRGEMMDERSLVFSVGVLLFERLTGKHPFGAEGNNPRRFARIRKGEFGSGVNHFPTVPSGLRTVLMRAMGPFREERYSTLGQLRAHLEQFAADQRPKPRLPGTTGRKQRPKPSTDSMTTRIVDMTQQLDSEREVAARRETIPLEQAAAQALARAPSARIVYSEDEHVLDRAVTEPKVEIDMKPVEPQRDLSGVIELHDQGGSDIQEAPAPEQKHLRTDTEARLYVPDVRPRPRMAPLLWATAGALVASIVFFVTRPATNATKASGAAAPATAVVKEDPAKTASAPSATSDDRDQRTATEAGTTATTAKKDSKPAAAKHTTFDKDLGGKNIVAAAESCFSEKRMRNGVRIGLGVVFPSDDTHKRKLYFAPKQLSLTERRCLHHALAHVSAGAPPEKTQLVEYSIWMHGDERKVDAELR
jgi:hypothetical protein